MEQEVMLTAEETEALNAANEIADIQNACNDGANENVKKGVIVAATVTAVATAGYAVGKAVEAWVIPGFKKMFANIKAKCAEKKKQKANKAEQAKQEKQVK